MSEVKEQVITNEKVRKVFFYIPNIKQHIATQQLNFVGKVVSSSDDQLPTKIITAWCNHKGLIGSLLNTKKKSILHNIRHIISGGDKTGALNT